MLLLIIMGIRWNYKYGHKYQIGLGISLFVIPCAVLLARLLFFLFLACPGYKIRFFDLNISGYMALGTILGGIFGALMYLELKKIPKIEGLEVFIPYIPIGGIFGRLGCFCQGCCHGIPTNFLLGLRFPKGSPAWAEHVSRQLISSDQFFSLPVHPTQLYEIGMWIIAGIVLTTIRNRKPRKGTIILSFLSIYFIMRFVEDFIRADYGKVVWNLDMMQLLAIVVVPLSLLGILFLYRSWKRSPAVDTEESITFE